ncbi:DNA (cytosine-5-)-methyltransferase family protein [Bacillus mycoides]|nr:DNA cytosine methyltransferase [Bacillus mycoides]AIW84313.1 DNA (cytosine-5-)-methyltransferase family protein [Bacillus mycoides]GAE42932.1 putative methyltransferase [Bacillus mycoides NBRC 101238 = DSM 11821]
MMQNGILSHQPRLESLREEKESSLLGILEVDVLSEYLVDIEKYQDCILEVTDEFVKVRQAMIKGYDIGHVGDSINISNPKSKTRRGRVGRSVAQTLLRSREQVTLQNWKLRWLTERESWRLQGITDKYFDRAKEVTSSNQLYAQAGNGLTVDIARFIGKIMGYEEE